MRLKELRKEKNLTQADIGKLINVAPNTYLNYEKELHEPPFDTLCKLADFYNVSLDYLIGRDYKDNVGYLNELQLNALTLLKKLNNNNLLQAIAYISGLLVGQDN